MKKWKNLPDNKEESWKFVRVNGEYRFVTIHQNHKDCVENGEKPESAGAFYFLGDGWKILFRHSSTLGVSMGSDDIENLNKLLNCKYIDD